MTISVKYHLEPPATFSPTIDLNGESNVREPLTLLLLALIELKTPLCVLKRHGAPRGNYACVHSAKPPKGLETEHVFFLLYVQAVSRSNRSHVLFVGKHGISIYSYFIVRTRTAYRAVAKNRHIV